VPVFFVMCVVWCVVQGERAVVLASLGMYGGRQTGTQPFAHSRQSQCASIHASFTANKL
jgi:hypothetical protein